MSQSDEHQTKNEQHSEPAPGSNGRTVKKIVFDDFQITRAEQQAQVDEERRVWQEREDRIQREKTPLFKLAVPRLKSLKDEMIGVQNKLPFLKRSNKDEHHEPPVAPPSSALPQPEYVAGNEPYFAEHERAVIHVVKKAPKLEEVAFEEEYIEPNVEAELQESVLVAETTKFVEEDLPPIEDEIDSYSIQELEDAPLPELDRVDVIQEPMEPPSEHTGLEAEH